MKSLPSLEQLSIESLSQHTEAINSLEGLPEQLVLCLFEVGKSLFVIDAFHQLIRSHLSYHTKLQSILSKGKLTPRLLQIFEDTDCDTLIFRIKSLGITDWIPPILPADSKKGWLGQRPPFS